MSYAPSSLRYMLAAASTRGGASQRHAAQVAPDSTRLKVSIDQECEQEDMRRLQGQLSHARQHRHVVVTRPRVRRAWCARRWRGTTRAAALAGTGGGEAPAALGASPPMRTPKKTRAAGAAAVTAGSALQTNPRGGAEPDTCRRGMPAAPVQRGGGDTPAPPGDTAAAGRQNPIAMLANAAPPSQLALAALSDGARAGGMPSGAPAVAAVPQFAAGASADGSDAGAAVPVSPVATAAPEPALGVSPDGGPPGASAGAAAHTTRDSVHGRHQSPPRRHIPAAVRRHVWQRDGGRCCYRDPLTGRRCNSSHLLQIDHLLPVAQGGGPDPDNLKLACFAHHRMRHGHGPEPPPEPPM